MGLSEDLAQETFVTAWQRLASLREPAKLRAWLCGINRFSSARRFGAGQGTRPRRGNARRRDEWSRPNRCRRITSSATRKGDPLALLERIPESYRQPLVLYYREHQSIEAVAQSLDLSEDAVKQRLSRGRKLLHQQVLGFVEAALERTKPDKAFALGVLAALPWPHHRQGGGGGVAIKGGSTVKAATSFAMLGRC